MTEEQNDREATLRSNLSRVESDVDSLLGKLSFSSEVGGVSQRASKLPELVDGLARLRHRGYVYQHDLDEGVARAQRLGHEAQGAVKAEAERAASRLRSRLDSLASRADSLSAYAELAPVGFDVDALETERDGIKSAVNEAEERVQAAAKPFTELYDQLHEKVGHAHHAMDLLDSAPYKLAGGENLISVIDATWEDHPGGKAVGMLLVTDQRVRFEHAEEVVTKRTLFFFASEKKMVRELKIDEPVGNLAASDDSRRGMIFKDELLTFKWSGETRKAPPQTTFMLSGISAKELDALIESVRSGEIARTRVGGAAGQKPAGTPLKWPERCSNCKGAMPVPVKGQASLKCPFCDTEHAVELA